MNLQTISPEIVSLLREILSLLVMEERLLLEGKIEEKKTISKKRYQLHKKLRFLDQQLSFGFDFIDFSSLKEVFDSLNSAIATQKKRNFSLQKRGCPQMLPLQKIANKKKKTTLMTLNENESEM